MFVDSGNFKDYKHFMEVLELHSTEIITEPKPLSGLERRKANLKLWKKGQSGNPAGRPKSKELRDLALDKFEQDPDGWIQRLAEERIDLYFAYMFGKPVDRLELSGPNGGQIEVHQTSAEDSVKALAAMGIVLPG